MSVLGQGYITVNSALRQGIAGDSSKWSQFEAIQNVDFNGYALENVGGGTFFSSDINVHTLEAEIGNIDTLNSTDIFVADLSGLTINCASDISGNSLDGNVVTCTDLSAVKIITTGSDTLMTYAKFGTVASNSEVLPLAVQNASVARGGDGSPAAIVFNGCLRNGVNEPIGYIGFKDAADDDVPNSTFYIDVIRSSGGNPNRMNAITVNGASGLNPVILLNGSQVDVGLGSSAFINIRGQQMMSASSVLNKFMNTTNSSSAAGTNGSVQIAGGVSCAKDVWCDRVFSTSGTFGTNVLSNSGNTLSSDVVTTFLNELNSSDSGVGAVVIHGGLAVQKDVVCDNLFANNVGTVESGTFTPSLTFNADNVDMTGTFTGNYVKIGSLVWVNINVTLTAKGSSTGQAQIEGLPYGNVGLITPGFTMICTNVNYATGAVPAALLNPSASTVTLTQITDNSQLSQFTDADFQDTSSVNITGVYQT